MRKRLPNSHALAIYHYGHQPVTSPFKIGYGRMLELGVAVWAEHKQVGWVMADIGVKMVYFKVRFPVLFFESERTKLTLSVMHFAKQNPDSRRYTLVAFDYSRTYPRTWLAYRLLGNSQQLFLGQVSGALSG